MKKIVITYPTNFDGELEQILSVLEDKKVILHLRKLDASEEVYEEILELIPEESIRQIVLHDYYHLAEKYAVAGIHLSTKKREQGEFVKSTNQQISTSTHSINELKEIDGQFDYAFLSPIFPSISKQRYEGNLDVEEIKTYLQSARKTKVIALGGIDERKIKQLEDWGFDGYAQLGSIWILK